MNGIYWECVSCSEELFFEFNEPGFRCRACRYIIEACKYFEY